MVLSRNLRVLTVLPLTDIDSTTALIAGCLAENDCRVEPRQIGEQAPVLLVPLALDLGLCSELIRVWDEGGHTATGVEASREGQRTTLLDGDSKRRQDHVVDDSKLTSALASAIGRRVMPELLRSFAYRADRFEGFKITCYDSERGGFFRPHRDNLSPSTAHRRFALTLNLNDDYDGGFLRFPEFGPHLYRPAAGEALLFSCSHLHEVTPVERGRRFTLLSFLYSGNEAERKRK